MSENNSGQVMLTADGVKKLEEELNYLKSVRRQEVAERIKTAISFGDLSENAEYDEAKNEQAFMEGRILNIEATLRKAVVIDESDISTDVVSIGSTVRVLIDGDEEEYTIVGTTEAEARTNRISNESPMGMALLGKGVDEIAKVEAPGGSYEMKVVAIHR